MMPSRYDHDPLQGPFFTNITGFYRNAVAHPASILGHPITTNPSSVTAFFDRNLPNLNTTSWNETLAEELRGSWDWASVARVDFNLKERTINGFDGHPNSTFHGWTWVRGALTLYQPEEMDAGIPNQEPPGSKQEGDQVEGTEIAEGKEEVDGGTNIEYDVYGLHHVRNGSYRLFGMPDGKRVDIRRIPTLFEGIEDHHLAQEVVLLELEKDVRSQKENLLLSDARTDCESYHFESYSTQNKRGICRPRNHYSLEAPGEACIGSTWRDADHPSKYCNVMPYIGLHHRPTTTSRYIPARARAIRSRSIRSYRNSILVAQTTQLLGCHVGRWIGRCDCG